MSCPGGARKHSAPQADQHRSIALIPRRFERENRALTPVVLLALGLNIFIQGRTIVDYRAHEICRCRSDWQL